MKRFLYVIICTLIIFVIFATAIFSSLKFGMEYLENLEIISPNGQAKLLIKEWGTIGGTGADIYLIEIYDNGLEGVKKEIGYTSSDDCCYPFKEGNYWVEWTDDSLTIIYYQGRQSERVDEPTTWQGRLDYQFE